MDITVCMAEKKSLEKQLFIMKSEVQSLRGKVDSKDEYIAKLELELNTLRAQINRK